MGRRKPIMDRLLFPEGKSRAFTMSYDDGTVHDRRLVEIMNKYGVRGTFNLNSGFFGQQDENRDAKGSVDWSHIEADEVRSLYAGHEVAAHGFYHSSPTLAGSSTVAWETASDKAELERLTGGLVRGYAYPYGHYNDNMKELLRLCGIKYARAVETTGDFGLPTDFLQWEGTCHHADPRLMELAEEFFSEALSRVQKQLFYVWGHSYEFTRDGNWDIAENLCRFMRERGADVWFATNIEIYDYVTAWRTLEYGAEGMLAYNPSALTLWLRRDGRDYKIAPLETVSIE